LKSSLVTVNHGRGGRKSYGFGGTARSRLTLTPRYRDDA
jgi:hypothetical protein